jgi:hypothetical protein
MAGDRQTDEVRRFAEAHRPVDAVVQRIGRDTWDLILIDGDGAWDRWVFASQEGAADAAQQAGAEVTDGWTDTLSQRVTRRDEWGTAGGTRRAL